MTIITCLHESCKDVLIYPENFFSPSFVELHNRHSMTEEQTAFQKVITRSYTDVQVGSEGIDTAQFLEATDGTVNMFGKCVVCYL